MTWTHSRLRICIKDKKAYFLYIRKYIAHWKITAITKCYLMNRQQSVKKNMGLESSEETKLTCKSELGTGQMESSFTTKYTKCAMSHNSNIKKPKAIPSP